MGACRAETAEAAEGPDEAEDTGCGRAVDRPAVGSDFPIGPIGTNICLPFGGCFLVV